MTPTSFTVSWNASSGVPSPQYTTQYRLTGTTAWTENPLGSTSALTQTVSNLTPPGAEWDVSVVASNIAGSATSAVVTVQLPLTQTTLIVDMVANLEWLAAAAGSPSGTLLTSTSGQIVDAMGAVWTLVASGA